MSSRITVRLSDYEADCLEQMVEMSPTTGVENTAELIRLWIHREWNKRRGVSKPSAASYQTAFRNGRPK